MTRDLVAEKSSSDECTFPYFELIYGPGCVLLCHCFKNRDGPRLQTVKTQQKALQ